MSNKEMKNSEDKAILRKEDKDENPYPLLEGLRGKDPFAVPEGYFDRLPAEILDNISEKDDTGRDVIRTVIEWKWPYKVALAASVIFIAFTIAYIAQRPQPLQPLISELQQITARELMEFDGYLVDLDESLFDDWIAQKGEKVSAEMLSMEGLDELTNDDIEEYLLSAYAPEELMIEEPY